MFDVIVRDKNGSQLVKERCIGSNCTIGKSRDNLIQIKGWKVAGIHAEFQQTYEGIFVIDRDTGNISVNGKKINDQYGPLKSKDAVEIADYLIYAGWEDESDNNNSAGVRTMIGVRPHSEIKSDSTVLRESRFLWRNKVHEELLGMMDLRRTDVGNMDEDDLRKVVGEMVDEIIQKMAGTLPPEVKPEELAKEVLDEAVGLGPLEELLADDSVTEIMVNKYDELYLERNGKLTKSDITFSSDNAVMSAIERIVSPLGRRIDESSPMVDARLKDGSRVNAIIPPLALRGPCITIRKFSKQKLTSDDVIKFGAISQPMVEFLKVAVTQHKNIIISGGTGSGKTTLLNILSNFIPENERIVTVEDAAELKLSQPHIVSLESRPPNLEGKGAIPIRDLVKNCLRMRPDRIVVGECRGGEALDMLQAMNTGHDGSLTTAHANTAKDLISRLEVMVMMAGMDLPAVAIREMVASSIHMIVQQSRFSDGSRKVTAITEITGVEEGRVQMQDIFVFQQEGFDENGRVKGTFKATGRAPEFYEDLRARGVELDMSIFA